MSGILTTLCGGLVYRIGIFEGLLIAMVVHGIIHFMVYTQNEKIPGRDVIRRYFDNLKKDSSKFS